MKKILVIEDEQTVRENILELLESEDFQAIGAANGRIGVQLALQQLPDLIICDLLMPELDGYGVLRTLRQEPLTATIPLIFLTAKAAKTDFRQGMEQGADDYLTKPFTRAELLGAIATQLEKQATWQNHFNNSEIKGLSPETQLLANKLRSAVEREELLVYYQPKINISLGKIIGAESLVRWQDPEIGLVEPAEFIGIAELTGLIVPIDEWVLKTACNQIQTWRDAGFESLHIAVNLSASQFNQPNLNQTILRVLEATNLDPHHLELELTESMIMQDVTTAIATMKELQLIGVKIAIDDFGTGYSSLSYLTKFPFNTLKIDRSFIQSIEKETQNSAITTALIQMAHNLNLNVVAEGVETEAELAFLRQHNCDDMQGFLFSPPVPAAEFEKLLFADKSLPMETQIN